MAHRKVLYSDKKVSIYERADEKGTWLCEDYSQTSHALCFTELGVVYVTNTADGRFIESIETLAECYIFCDNKNLALREIKINWLENYLEGSN